MEPQCGVLHIFAFDGDLEMKLSLRYVGVLVSTVEGFSE